MGKSKPLVRKYEVNNEEDDNVQELLQSLNSETYVVEPEPQQQQPQYAEQYAEDLQEEQQPPSQILPSFAGMLTFDIKMSIICAILYIVVSQIPLEKLVYNYISLDKIPYSDVIVKAIIIGGLFFLIARFI
jgi:hypothetical protein